MCKRILISIWRRVAMLWCMALKTGTWTTFVLFFILWYLCVWRSFLGAVILSVVQENTVYIYKRDERRVESPGLPIPYFSVQTSFVWETKCRCSKSSAYHSSGENSHFTADKLIRTDTTLDLSQKADKERLEVVYLDAFSTDLLLQVCVLRGRHPFLVGFVNTANHRQITEFLALVSSCPMPSSMMPVSYESHCVPDDMSICQPIRADLKWFNYGAHGRLLNFNRYKDIVEQTKPNNEWIAWHAGYNL